MSILLEFMEKYQDIGRGFTKKDKYTLDSLWNNLVLQLNSEAPPKKDVSGWKKVHFYYNLTSKILQTFFKQVWFDWKCHIRKKIAHNKKETKKTGGGPCNILPISAEEDAVAKLTGIYTAVDGINETSSFGVPTGSDKAEMVTAEAESVDLHSPMNTSIIESEVSCSEPRSSRRTYQRSTNIDDYMEWQKNSLTDITKKIGELADVGKENQASLKRTYRAIEKLCDVIKSQNEETRRHHLEMERRYQELNKIKKRRVEIEEIKLKIASEKNL